MPKAQHSSSYRLLPVFLKNLRESVGMTQRQLGKKLRKPQSWIYNCETANRRVDVTEFISWCEGCGVEPKAGFAKLLERSR